MTSGRRRGDEDLFRAACAEHGAAVEGCARRWTTRYLNDPGAAPDVAQEVLIRLWKNLDVLANSSGVVRAWLLTVTHRIVIDRARLSRNRREILGVEGAEQVVADHADRTGTAVALHAAMKRLSPPHRAVLEQIYLHDRGMAQAAAALGIPTGTVKSRTYYALRALREAMAPLDTSRPTPWEVAESDRA